MSSIVTEQRYGGSVEVFFGRVPAQGKTIDLDIETRVAYISLRRFWGTTIFDPSKENLEPARDHCYKIFDVHRKNFPLQLAHVGNEEKELRFVLGDIDTMATYHSGIPWSEEYISNVHFLDSYRPSAGAVNHLIPEGERPITYLDEATPWTGYAIFLNNINGIKGRAAMGSCSDPESCELGLVIHKNFQRLRHQAEIALLAQLLVFSRLGFQLYNEKGKCTIRKFSFTLSPKDAIIKQLSLPILEDSFFPYGDNQERSLVELPIEALPKILNEHILKDGIEHQITINGKNPLEFFREAGV